MDIANVISLLSGIALFLFGMTLMGDGLKQIAGRQFEHFLYRLTSTQLRGILLGTGVTAVIQSSSATSIMTIGFVNSGMMRFKQSISIILGAIIGTSITGWILCLSELHGGEGWVSLLSVTTISGLIAIAGILILMIGKRQLHKHIGNILLGFSVLMYGMSMMSGAVSPLRESPVFTNILTTFSHPLVGILAGLAFTAIIQSASASVGILQALTATGVIDFATAFPIIMGIAIGASLPVLISALNATTEGKRTAYTYLIVNVLGALILGSVFYILNAFIGFGLMSRTMTMVSVALVNSIYRVLIVLILTPFIGWIEKLLTRLIPERHPSPLNDVDFEINLEERFIQFPALAIAQCREFMNALALTAQAAIRQAISLFDNYTEADYDDVKALETRTDRYEDQISSYLVKVTQKAMSRKDNAEASKFLHTLSDFERIADHALNLANSAREVHEKKITYSAQAQSELLVVRRAVTDIIEMAVASFIDNDSVRAQQVEPLEQVIDDLCNSLKNHHIDRLKEGVCTIEQGFTFNDQMTNYERISDHCSNVALAIIELQENNDLNVHEYSHQLADDDQSDFRKYYNEFRDRYSIS